MKFVKVLAALLMVFMVSSAFSLKKSKSNGLYIVGVSASFSDSLIYFTDIQFVDSVVLDKDKMLPMRGQYSDQLDAYLEQKLGLENRTCFIYFNEKKHKLENTSLVLLDLQLSGDWEKLMDIFTNTSNFRVGYVCAEHFAKSGDTSSTQKVIDIMEENLRLYKYLKRTENFVWYKKTKKLLG